MNLLNAVSACSSIAVPDCQGFSTDSGRARLLGPMDFPSVASAAVANSALVAEVAAGTHLRVDGVSETGRDGVSEWCHLIAGTRAYMFLMQV